MSRDFRKVALVTGGVKGIGLACVKAFLSEGLQVAIFDIDDDGVALAKTLGEDAIFIKCDVSKEAQVKQGVQEVVATFKSIDILVNNAGIQRYSIVTETTEEEWDLVMNVNLKSAFLCAKHTIPEMQKRGVGVILNIASVQSLMTQNNVAAYTTAKSAMLGLTRSIAVDYAPTIRCMAICPGTVDTPMVRDSFALSPDPDAVYQECVDMHLTKRIAKPEEIGNLVLFLASEKASFFTGHPIRIDGGLGVMIQGSKR